MTAAERKDQVRRLALARRARLTPDERSTKAEAIHATVRDLPELAGDGPVVAYVGVRTEVPTEALLRWVLEQGRTLALPTVADDGTMRAAPVSSLEELSPGYRGIPEPRHAFPIDPAEAAVAIVPGVAFDARGGRLGYGGGFFDRFLAAAPDVLRVGLCFDVQVVDDLPQEEHDERVGVVVTEDRILRA